MSPFLPFSRSGAAALLLLTASLGGCSDETLGPNGDVAFLVGDWEAERFVVRSLANPEVAPDLIADPILATFTVNVQPSGGYTAILTYLENPLTEIGTLEVEGSEIVFNRSFPCCSVVRSTWSGQGDHIRLVGETEFDFNQDGTPEDGEATIDLVRR